MIKKLKRRFIALAMASLIVLLTVIVAGMNIINYNTVINEADRKLAALSVNGGMLPFMDSSSINRNGLQGSSGFRMPFSGSSGTDSSDDDLDYDDYDDYDDIDASTREGIMGYGRGKPFSSRDEAEETRFFSVLLTAEESVVRANTDRIYAVDDSEAADYATAALKQDNDIGWVDEYRFTVTPEGSLTRITFLDCSTSLAQFRRFLYASIIMSVAGLLIIFVFICYFAGRIVKPVAESYEKQKRFITDAGHELKTPITIIRADADVLRADLDEENEWISDIRRQTNRLAELTEELIYLSRMEEENAALQMQELSLSELVDETARSFQALARSKGKTFSSSVAPDLHVSGDEKALAKLVSVLLDNAMKYSTEGGTVELGLREVGRNARLTVKNSTPPMEKGNAERLFERFTREDRSRSSESGGFGLGLAIAKAVTEAHRGRIRAESEDGASLTVTAELPLC